MDQIAKVVLTTGNDTPEQIHVTNHWRGGATTDAAPVDDDAPS